MIARSVKNLLHAKATTHAAKANGKLQQKLAATVA